MGLLNDETYYYFVTSLITRRVTIEKFITKMLGSRFEELTDEQVTFYLAHPNASVEEVRKCELNPEPIIPVPSLTELKENAIRQLKEINADKMNQYSDLKVVEAISSHYALTTLTISDTTPYSMSEAKQIIEGFNALGKSCKNIYDNYYTIIANAVTKDVIDEAINNAIEEYDKI